MSAIFGERLTYRDEHGDTVELRVWGDEFYARRETLSGYTVVYDTALGRYCYAQLVSGFFTSTGVPISKPPPPGLPRHLSEWPAVRRRRTAVRTRALTPPSLTAADDVLLTLGPAGGLLRGRRVSSGLVRGLTILVTFPDQTTTVTQSHVDALLNREDYNLDGNRGSVRDFWLAMSNAKLDYRNDVVGPYTLARPMSDVLRPGGHAFTGLADPARGHRPGARGRRRSVALRLARRGDRRRAQHHVRRPDDLPDAVLAAQQRVRTHVPRRGAVVLLHDHEHGPEPVGALDRHVLPRGWSPAVPVSRPLRLRRARRRPGGAVRAWVGTA